MDFWIIILTFICLGAYFYLPSKTEPAPEPAVARQRDGVQEILQLGSAAFHTLTRVKVEHLVGFAVLALDWARQAARRS